MRAFVLLVTFATAVCGAASAAESGRFQIAQATSADGRPISILIDTQTARTWQLIGKLDEKGTFAGSVWFPLHFQRPQIIKPDAGMTLVPDPSTSPEDPLGLFKK